MNNQKTKKKVLPAKKEKGGRPKLEIDYEQLDKLLGIMCTGEECSHVLGVSYDTLERRVKEKHGVSFADYSEQKRNIGKASLRRRQFQEADNGNITMLIFLGKQYLGQADKIDNSIKSTNIKILPAPKPGERTIDEES